MKVNDITKEMHETNSDFLHIRINPSLKYEFYDFCADHGFTVTDGLKAAIINYMEKHNG